MSLRKVIEREEQPQPRQLFKENKDGNVFTDMLQQTLNEGYAPGTMQKIGPQLDAGQQLVQVSDVPDRRSMVDAIGYGRMGSNSVASVPGTIQVPEKTPDGKPIDVSKIPPFLLKAMNKDYSKTLENSKKADKARKGY